jgi:hypothetical protein
MNGRMTPMDEVLWRMESELRLATARKSLDATAANGPCTIYSLDGPDGTADEDTPSSSTRQIELG